MILSDAASAHTIRWIHALASRGHDILLFTLTPAPADAYRTLGNLSVVWPGVDAGVALHGEGASSKLRYLRALPHLKAQIRRWRPDLVHAHYASSYGLLATLARAHPRIVSVWGMDVYSFPHRTPFHKYLIKVILARADVVLSTSRIMRKQVTLLVDRPVTVTPFGVDTARFCPPAVRRQRATLCVGTVKALEDKYGIDYLLRAFAIVLEKGSHPGGYRLSIVGAGSRLNRLKQLSADLGIEDKVEFAGPAAYADVHRRHQDLDLAVYPSIESSESFGVAAVESQSCGVPVVVSHIGGLPEVVVERRTGLLVPPRDEAALATAMLEILDNPELRRRMGEAGRQHVVDNFSITACTDIMEQVYASVMAPNAASSGHGLASARPDRVDRP